MEWTGEIVVEVWTVGIFGDEVSDEVQFQYQKMIRDGEIGEKVTSTLVNEYLPKLKTSDEISVFWLSLAAVQWKLGRLEEEVKRKALSIIDTGEDLLRWEDLKLKKKREKVLERVRGQLLSPQSPPKKLRKKFVASTDLEAGDLVVYTMASGKKVILSVICTKEWPSGDVYPMFDLYNYIGVELPSFQQVQYNGLLLSGLMVFPDKKSDYPHKRLAVIGKGVSTTNIQEPLHTVCWEDFDWYLEQWFK